MAEQNSKEHWLQARYSQRSQILTVILGTGTVAGFFVILQSLLRIFQDPRQWTDELQYLVPYALIVLVFSWKTLDYRIRLALPILGIYVVGIVVLLRDGVVGHGLWYLFLAPLLVFPLAGWVAGFLTLVLSAAIYVGTAFAHLQGWLDIQSLPDPRVPYQLFNYSVTYAMVLILIGIGQGMFNRNQNRTLQSVYELNESLSDAQNQLQIQHQDLQHTVALLQLQSRIVTVSMQVLRDLVGIDDVTTLLRTGMHAYYERLASSGLLCASIYSVARETGRAPAFYRSVGVPSIPITFVANAGEKNAIDKNTTVIPEIIYSAFRSGIVAFSDYTNQKTGEVSSVEIALPIQIQQRIHEHVEGRIYVLYLLFDKLKNLVDVDPVVWDTVGEHLAIAIQQSNMLHEAHREVNEVLRSVEKQAQDYWQDSFEQGTIYSTVAAPDRVLSDTANQALLDKVMVTEPGSDDKKSSLAVPIKIRDEVLGVVDIQGAGTDHEWSEEELTLVEVVVEQLGLALDSARLYEDSQRRSHREQVTIEVTERIRSTLDVNTILETAVREIGEVMGLDDLTIALHDVSAKANE